MADLNKLTLSQLLNILQEYYGYSSSNLLGKNKRELIRIIREESESIPINFDTEKYHSEDSRHSRSSKRSMKHYHDDIDDADSADDDADAHNERLYKLTGAIVYNDLHKVKQLVDEGSDINDVLLISHKFNKHHISKYARDNGADVNLDW